MSRCKEEKLVTAATVAEADKLLAETGCAVPGGASHTVKKEAAAAIVWMRAHAQDTTEQFDALPEEGKEALKRLYKVLPGAPGMHWSKKIFRLFHAFSAADSPVKENRARQDEAMPSVDELELGDEQRRPADDEAEELGAGEAQKEKAARDKAKLLAQRQREDEQMLAAGIESYLARQASKRQKDASVPSPESLKELAAARKARAGDKSWARVKQTWLARAELEKSLPEDVLAGLWLAGKWKADAVNKALKNEEREGQQANSRFESLAPLWAHRLQFFLGDHPRDTPDLNVVGKNLALVTRMCLPGREAPLAKMVTDRLREAWQKMVDRLAEPGQAPESDLRDSFECVNEMMKERERILLDRVADCGPAGEEVVRAAALQTRLVKGMWDFLARGLADGLLTSPGRSTANAVWLTVLGPAMDQRTNSAPNGDTSLASAQARLSARHSSEASGSDTVKRRLAPALAQSGAGAASRAQGGVQAMPMQMGGAGWAPVPAWGPPPPAYVQPPPMWAQLPLQQPLAIAPPPAVLRILPPPSSAPPPLQAPPAAARAGVKQRSDGWTGQPTSTAMLGDRGVVVAEDVTTKNHCVMCSRTNPGARVHLAWECAIKLARRTNGEPCPGFDAEGNRVPSAWNLEGNLQPATVQSWVAYIERWGLEVAASAPGPPRLS